MMDREEECVCCHKISQVRDKNDEVFEYMKPREPYTCVTDNPGFKTGCLDRWVLQIAWLQYKQEYGGSAYEGPEHKLIDMLHIGSLSVGVREFSDGIYEWFYHLV